MSDTPASRDHGASAERTRLAWRRTALSGGVVALLACRPAVDPTAGGTKWIAAALAMLGWSVLVAVAYRRMRGLAVDPPRPGRRTMTAYALTTVALATLGGLVVML